MFSKKGEHCHLFLLLFEDVEDGFSLAILWGLWPKCLVDRGFCYFCSSSSLVSDPIGISYGALGMTLMWWDSLNFC